MSAERSSPLVQLFLMRWRNLWREPGTVFWIFGFPLLTSLALGLAFRRETVAELPVGVHPQAAVSVAELEAVDGLAARALSVEEGKGALRRGEVALWVLPGDPPELVFDPARPEARAARLLVLRTLELRAGRLQPLPVRETAITAPGGRYIDFLIPGMLGFGLMSSSVWGLGYGLVQMRTGKLLKRFAATPMRRSDFLLAFILSRVTLALAEILFFVLFARWLFDVHVFGSLATFVGVGIFGTLAFSAIALLVGSRARNAETAGGLANLVIMPMMLLSGVFFSVRQFPAWLQPLIQILPLTALNDALRAVMIDGKGLVSLGAPVAVLGAWGVVSFVAALRLFRWS